MSYNAWETTSPTSLHPLTHFFTMLLYSLLILTTTSSTTFPKHFCMLVSLVVKKNI